MNSHTRYHTDAKGNCSAACFQDFSRWLTAVSMDRASVARARIGVIDSCALPACVSQAPNSRAQKRAAGDRLQARLGVGKTHEQTPPVVGQRHGHRTEATALQIVGGEPTPTGSSTHRRRSRPEGTEPANCSRA